MSLILIYILVMIPTVKSYIGMAMTPAGVALAVVALILTVIAFGRGMLGYLSPEVEVDVEAKAATDSQLSGAWKYVRGLGYAYALAAVVFVILPSERQMYVMAGAYAVTNIDGIAKLPENAVGAANAWLKRLGDAAAADGDAAAASEITKATSALSAAPVK